MNNTDTITSKQLIFIIIGAQVGIGIFSLPRLVSAEAQQDAWLSILLNAILPLLTLIITERLGRRMPQSNFVGMNHLLFGRWLGSVMVFLFASYVIFVQATLVRIFAEITVVFLLPRTPVPIVILTVVLAVVYTINKGARVVARLNEVLFWIVLPLLFLAMVPLINADFTNLLPLGGAGVKAIARGVLSGIYAFAGIEVLLVYYFLVDSKDKVIKAGILGLGWTTLVYLIVTVICLLVWGIDIIQSITWPSLTLLKSTRIVVLERPELILLMVWVAVAIRPTITSGFAAYYSLSEVLHVKRNKQFNLVLVAGALVIYILALLPANLIVAFVWMEYAGYTYLLAGLLYPLLMLLISVFKGKETQSA